MKINYKRKTLITAIAMLAGMQAIANETTVRSLDRVVVTATGTEAPVRDVQASVEVLGRDQLDSFGSASVGQVLKQSVGVSTSVSGATGDISIRGFNRNHTLILIDGFRRTNNYGSNNISQIGFFDIDRVEIVRGPLSSLYGSDALGGVVNVITRQPGSSPGTDVYFRTGLAERGRESLLTGINHRTGDSRLGHSFTLEQNYRDRLSHRDSTTDDFGRLNNWSGSYRGRWTPDGTRSMGWALEAFDRDSRSRAIGHSRFEKEKRYFASLDFRQDIGAGELTVRASAGSSKGSTNRSHPNVETTDFRQYQTDMVYQVYPHDLHQLSIGAGGSRDKLDVSINSREASRRNWFLLLQDQWQINDNWLLVAGVRHDRYDDFGGTTNPRISLGWTSGDWSARLGYGSAFRAPSLLEQYSSFARGRLLIRGNPDLKPEQSKTWEGMLRREFGDGHVELTLHRNRIDQLIDSFTTAQMVGPLRVVEYRNIGKAKIVGAELSAVWPLRNDWVVTASVEWLRAMNADTNERLTGRPKQTWRLESRHQFHDWTVTARARHLRNYLAVGVTAPRGAPPYNSRLTVADLAIQYRHRSGFEFFGGVDNVFNQRDPGNFSITATGTQRNDPDARFIYVGGSKSF